jgi:hypothetical protein
MYQLTYTDTLRMEGVLAEARHILAELEQVAQGEKVKITFYPADGQAPFSYCYPVRVARYARKMMGAQAPFYEVAKVSFTRYDCTRVYLPTVDGYRAFVRALLAHNEACLRRRTRLLTKLGYQKGGQAL